MQALLKGGAQSIVGLDMIDINGIAARLRIIQDVKKCRPGWLLLVCDVAVPSDAGRVFSKQILPSSVIGPAVHEMDLGISFGGAVGGMDV